MNSKINSNISRSKKGDRNVDENPRSETNNLRPIKGNTIEQEQNKVAAERISRRGYYSRNGGYSGYRGL